MNVSIVAERIKQCRIDCGYTCVYVAHSLSIDQSYYSKIERGKHEIKLSLLIDIANFFNVSLDYLTGRTDYLYIYYGK